MSGFASYQTKECEVKEKLFRDIIMVAISKLKSIIVDVNRQEIRLLPKVVEDPKYFKTNLESLLKGNGLFAICDKDNGEGSLSTLINCRYNIST